MEELDKEQKIELRSEEVQEIMGQIPPWIQRWGLTVMMGLLVIFFIICYILRFPQTLTAEVILTSATPPIELHARATGKFMYMEVTDKQTVREGDILAVIHNTAKFEDVLRFKELYASWKNGEIRLDSLLTVMNERKWKMGELQNAFVEFKQSIEEYSNFQQRNYFPQKIALKEKERNKRRDMIRQQEQTFHIVSEQAEVARKIFARDSTLFNRQIGTEEEYDQARLTYLQSRQAMLDNTRQREEMAMLEIDEKNTELDLQNQYNESLTSHEQALFVASGQMEAQLSLWEQTYVLKSPIDGTVNLMGIWSKNQYVTNGELVFIILPTRIDAPLGKAWLPASGAGKVEIGQRVNVRLNNFPDKEYGFLIGRVRGISAIPNEESLYFVNIDFPNGLVTNYQKELPQSRQMIGTAQIVTEDKRLIEKFMEPISKIIREQKRDE